MATVLAPIIVDLGKTSRKQVKALLRGDGGLVEDIQDAMAQIHSGLGDDAASKRLLPLVVVYTKKRTGSYLKIPLPF